MMKNPTLSPKSVSRDVIKRLGIVTPKKGRADAATSTTHYDDFSSLEKIVIYIITAWIDKQNTVSNSFQKKFGCGSGTHLKFVAILKYLSLLLGIQAAQII